MAHADDVRSIACSPDGQQIVSGSWDTTINGWELHPYPPIQTVFSCDNINADFCARPDVNGWVKDSKHGLLYCVFTDCRTGLHPPAVLTVPPTSHTVLILRTLSVEPLGPGFSIVHTPKLFVQSLRLYFRCVTLGIAILVPSY